MAHSYSTFRLGTDEAHYVLYAKFRDLSYFDHPPLVGRTHALFFNTLGTNEFVARLPAILFFAITSFLCYRFTLPMGGKRPVLLATAALNSSFLLSGLGLMLFLESLSYHSFLRSCMRSGGSNALLSS